MKKYILLIIIFVCIGCKPSTEKQKNKTKPSLEIIDLTSLQLKLMEEFKDKEQSLRDSVFIREIFTPNLELWNSYLGEEKDFLEWLNTSSFHELNEYQKKRNSLNLNTLSTYFFETSKKIKEFTGFKPKGKWYIIFGPKWTDAGGFKNGTMVLDLAHSKNNLQHIQLIFPHELNHQIYSHTLPSFKGLVLKRIIDEGFATYVSWLFNNKQTTIAQQLQYTEKELKYCIENEEKIMHLLTKHHTSNNNDIANLFASRSYKIGDKFPGAIGYYIGFRIIEEYVDKNGENSWKNIYKMTPENVLEESGILSQKKKSCYYEESTKNNSSFFYY